MAKEKEIDIIALEFPNNVRTRPGMYIGATDKPDVILREAIDNAIDESMGSIKCNRIDVQLKDGKRGGWYVIADNGRGIPINLDADKGITKTEMAVGSLNAGSKFVKDSEDVSVGLNGVGISCTNALSKRFLILSKVTHLNYDKSYDWVKSFWENAKDRSEIFYVLYFEYGVKIAEGVDYKSKIEANYDIKFPEQMSTITSFIPDDTIWDSIEANYNKRSLSYINVILEKFYNKLCEIRIDGQLVDEAFQPYKYELIKDINITDGDKTKSAKFYINFELDKDMSVCDLSGSINSLVVNRGLHIDWGKRIFMESLKSYFNLQHDYTWCGLKMNVICMTSNMDFSSQTKERCVKIDGLHYDDIAPKLRNPLYRIFGDNLSEFETHVQRVNEFADSINKISAINKVRSIVGTVDGGNRVRSKLPSSVRDAASNNRKDCELFIIEGKSAASTMVKSRDPRIHALMELRGVPLNSINLDLDQIMDNPEMCSIVTAIGAGVNEYFNIDNCRYGKIILAADSDPDGERINSMILGFIAKKMTFLIEEGMVYVALAPLYQQGDKYVYPGEDPSKIIDMSKPAKRYKGLGEINTVEARNFYFNPDTRRLLQIRLNDLPYVFNLLTSSLARKTLMIDNAIITDKYNTGII